MHLSVILMSLISDSLSLCQSSDCQMNTLWHSLLLRFHLTILCLISAEISIIDNKISPVFLLPS